MKKPGRPLGLSLAILISFMLFTLLPIAQVIFVLSLRQQFQTIEFLEGGGAIGGDLKGFEDIQLIVPVITALIFAVVAALAWVGRPKRIRLIFVSTVVLITMITLGMTISSMYAPDTIEQGMDSGAGFIDSLLIARVAVSLLVALYVMWYVNRGPARAFYRGHYLSDPADTVHPEG